MVDALLEVPAVAERRDAVDVFELRVDAVPSPQVRRGVPQPREALVRHLSANRPEGEAVIRVNVAGSGFDEAGDATRRTRLANERAWVVATTMCAVAQAEIEDHERLGAYCRLAFHGPDGDVMVETTRPELLPACVALVVNPDDARYADLVGSTLRTPLLGVVVPVYAHRLADPDKGTGIAMVCTFGDTADVTWWRELQLPTRAVIGWDGRFVPDAPDGVPAAVFTLPRDIEDEGVQVPARLREPPPFLDQELGQRRPIRQHLSLSSSCPGSAS
jgi:hypothetical protein